MTIISCPLFTIISAGIQNPIFDLERSLVDYFELPVICGPLFARFFFWHLDAPIIRRQLLMAAWSTSVSQSPRWEASVSSRRPPALLSLSLSLSNRPVTPSTSSGSSLTFDSGFLRIGLFDCFQKNIFHHRCRLL